jgi:hypothetical protein
MKIHTVEPEVFHADGRTLDFRNFVNGRNMKLWISPLISFCLSSKIADGN